MTLWPLSCALHTSGIKAWSVAGCEDAEVLWWNRVGLPFLPHTFFMFYCFILKPLLRPKSHYHWGCFPLMAFHKGIH
jgi:hypothetical protein